tara:strand:- start:105 stop:398 length:294 start_codon:yes stop_codon:yes gene_type:complete
MIRVTDRKAFFKYIRNIIDKDITDYEDIVSRRQLETYLRIKESHKIRLLKVEEEEPEKAVLFCNKGVKINYDGLVTWNTTTGFYPIDWSPFSGKEDE